MLAISPSSCVDFAWGRPVAKTNQYWIGKNNKPCLSPMIRVRLPPASTTTFWLICTSVYWVQTKQRTFCIISIFLQQDLLFIWNSHCCFIACCSAGGNRTDQTSWSSRKCFASLCCNDFTDLRVKIWTRTAQDFRAGKFQLRINAASCARIHQGLVVFSCDMNYKQLMHIELTMCMPAHARAGQRTERYLEKSVERQDQ